MTGTVEKKASKPAKLQEHPKYSDMIKEAIAALKERGGSSRQAIVKYIKANYKVADNVEVYLRSNLKRMAAKNVIVHTKGIGASGSFKLKKEEKPKKKKVVNKPAVKKPAVKKPTVKNTKKPAAKKEKDVSKKEAKPKKPAEAKPEKEKEKKPTTKKTAKPKAAPKSKPAKKDVKKPAAKKAAKSPKKKTATKKGAAKK